MNRGGDAKTSIDGSERDTETMFVSSPTCCRSSQVVRISRKARRKIQPTENRTQRSFLRGLLLFVFFRIRHRSNENLQRTDGHLFRFLYNAEYQKEEETNEKGAVEWVFKFVFSIQSTAEIILIAHRHARILLEKRKSHCSLPRQLMWTQNKRRRRVKMTSMLLISMKGRERERERLEMFFFLSIDVEIPTHLTDDVFPSRTKTDASIPTLSLLILLAVFEIRSAHLSNPRGHFLIITFLFITFVEGMMLKTDLVNLLTSAFATNDSPEEYSDLHVPTCFSSN